MAVFGLAALVLALTGIYAVVLYSASQRAREIAIRVALGASRASIVRLVMAHGVRFVVIGLIAGAAIAVGAVRLLSTMLFGVAATDALTFAEVVVVVGGASIVACAVPTARLGVTAVGSLSAE